MKNFRVLNFLMILRQTRVDLEQMYDVSRESGVDGLLMWWSLWGYRQYPDVWSEYSAVKSYLKESVQTRLQDGSLVDGLRVFNALAAERANLFESFFLSSETYKEGLRWFIKDFISEEQLTDWMNDSEKSFGSLRTFDLPKKRGINIIGHARGQLGVGEDVRLLSRALDSVGIPHSIFNYPFECAATTNDRSAESRILEENPHNINIFCLPAFDCLLAQVHLGPSFFQGRFNIAYNQWELPHWPKVLVESSMFFDQLWLSSRFTLDSIAGTSLEGKGRLMPMNVELQPFERKSRRDFGLEDNVFYFIFAFDFISSIHRKNPILTIEAFLEAFSGQPNVKLIVKSTYRDLNNEDVQKFSSFVKGNNQIVWIHESLTKSDFISLLSLTDAFVSLHRSEGFGRNITEAMLLEKPVVTVGWSGNADFCTRETAFLVEYDLIDVKPGQYSFVDGQYWSDARKASAVQAMRLVYQNRHNRLVFEKVSAAKKTIETYYDKVSVGKRYLSELTALGLL